MLNQLVQVETQRMLELRKKQKPSLTHGTQQLVQLSSLNAEEQTWERPKTVSAQQQAEAAELRDWLIVQRQPITIDQLKVRLKSFLAHFWVDKASMPLADQETAEFTQTVEAGKSLDWIRSFKEFPLQVVDAACLEYLSQSKKKPTIADLRAICLRIDTDATLAYRLHIVATAQVRVATTEEARMTREESQRASAWLSIARQRTLSDFEMDSWKRGEWPPADKTAVGA